MPRTKRTPSRPRRKSARLSAKKTVDSKAVPADTKESRHWEFGGPIGTWVTMWCLPLVNFWLLTTIEDGNAESVQDAVKVVLNDPRAWLSSMYAADLASYALKTYVAWFLFQFTLHAVLPGRKEKGTKLEDGSRLTYLLNGYRAYLFTLVCFAACAADKLYGTFGHRLFDPTVVVSQKGTFLTYFRAANCFSWAFALVLYMGCRTEAAAGLKKDLCTGCIPYDYFMGCTKNPRLFGWFDIKFFCESRPGLILWVLFNFCFAMKQYEELDGRITYSMGLVCFFQFFYILDYFWQEQSILTTMDIKHDPFGWMLCFGDLAWVPFSYSLQAFYLYHNPRVDVSLPVAAGIFALHFLGYRIFRESNNQKHNFRTGHPDGRTMWGQKVESIKTKRGTKLLLSGWWGLSRHPNYLGDISMALAYSLPCGFGSLFPYFYPIYFWILLVHRERRDNHHCSSKYGKDWEKYCKRVPYRIIPYVY